MHVAAEIARLELQGLDQCIVDSACCCINVPLSFGTLEFCSADRKVDYDGVGHKLPAISPLNDFRYLHVGINSCYDCLSAKWFPRLSLDTSEIDLHVATRAAFDTVVKHSNIYNF